jgi:hypothetical protein
MRPAHEVCEPDASCYGSDGLYFQKPRFCKGQPKLPINIDDAKIHTNFSYLRPKMRSAFLHAFY